jgi:hypothetical protein
MSTWFDEEVKCPQCSAQQIAKLAHGVHASRAPEVRDMLFDRTFHRITCRECQHVFVGQRPLVYTDMDRKHWLQVEREIARPRWPELEQLTDEVFVRAFTGSPLTHELRDGFKRRLVFGLEELREKLVIWRASLDDAVVECLKLHAIAREPDLSRAESIVVDEVHDGGLRLVVDATRVIQVPGDLVEQYHDDVRLPDRFPELFGGRFVSIHRLLGHRYKWTEP